MEKCLATPLGEGQRRDFIQDCRTFFCLNVSLVQVFFTFGLWRVVTSSANFIMEERLKQASVFQWNARGLQSRLSDFRQFSRKYNFPVIVICESNLSSDFRLSGYEVFHSDRPHYRSRVMVCVRRDLTYVNHPVQVYNNEYVGITVKHWACVLTVIGA